MSYYGVVLYQTKGGTTKINAPMRNETVCLSQVQISELQDEIGII